VCGGDCCMHPNCLFHDVVSCNDGIASFRCWKDGLSMFMDGDHSIFGLSCNYDTWQTFDKDNAMMNSWIGNYMVTHNEGIRSKIRDMLEKRELDKIEEEVVVHSTQNVPPPEKPTMRVQILEKLSRTFFI